MQARIPAIFAFTLLAVLMLVPQQLAGATIEPTRAVLLAGSTFSAGTRMEAFVSESADVADLFRHRSVLFHGWKTGGSEEQVEGAHLVYRIRLEFARPVRLTSIRVRSAGHQDENAQIRLLDSEMKILAAKKTSGFNVLSSTTISLEAVEGRVFVLEEYDYSTNYRYRDWIEIAATETK